MKNILLVTLLLSMGFITYFFVEEQIKGVVLSKGENIFLSVLYLIVGISVFLLIRIKTGEKKKQ
ncbi:hypothetical protein FW778_09195 [Ginsengibacter hankyongi]|uniref:Uncharacterized protein n=1 Tax=Ginsengibacter hankyongi TaxID=2607284 RepID=A0A5J5IRI5_9BACT|nr:hypothetical protein [Ginsengibacter hankyongi]KAA9042172.1 hypothetical protein FW778_09195 [Ginsengibacter hankyongi]